jgi:hypothetical protein
MDLTQFFTTMSMLSENNWPMITSCPSIIRQKPITLYEQWLPQFHRRIDPSRYHRRNWGLGNLMNGLSTSKSASKVWIHVTGVKPENTIIIIPRGNQQQRMGRERGSERLCLNAWYRSEPIKETSNKGRRWIWSVVAIHLQSEQLL